MSTTLTEEKKELIKQIENSCDSAISGMRKLNKSLESKLNSFSFSACEASSTSTKPIQKQSFSSGSVVPTGS